MRTADSRLLLLRVTALLLWLVKRPLIGLLAGLLVGLPVRWLVVLRQLQ